MGSGKKLGAVIIPLDTLDQTPSASKPEDQAMEYSIHGSLNQELIATITVVLWWNEPLQGEGGGGGERRRVAKRRANSEYFWYLDNVANAFIRYVSATNSGVILTTLKKHP